MYRIAIHIKSLLKGNSMQAKTHAPLIDPFCHINLPGRHNFCQSCLYFHTGRTPWPAPPPAYNESQLSSRLVLLGGQLRESSRYGNTDSFGKNYVYQVGCYGKRSQLKMHCRDFFHPQNMIIRYYYNIIRKNKKKCTVFVKM